jgi:hypothetical protein
MSASPIAALVLLAAAIQAPVPDNAFEPVGRMATFDFDVPDGYFREWNRKIECPVNALRVTVHFTRYGKPATPYQPGVNAWLYSGDGAALRAGRIGFHAMAFRPPFLVAMTTGDSKRTWSRVTFTRQTGESGWFSFELHWLPDGTAIGSAGGQTGTVNMHAIPQRIHIVGFSGAGEMWIQLGYIPSKARNDVCRPVA